MARRTAHSALAVAAVAAQAAFRTGAMDRPMLEVRSQHLLVVQVGTQVVAMEGTATKGIVEMDSRGWLQEVAVVAVPDGPRRAGPEEQEELEG